MIYRLPHLLMVEVHVHLMGRDKLVLHYVLHLRTTDSVVRDSLCVTRLRLLD